MGTNDSVTIFPLVRDDGWKQNGTNFFRLRLTFRRQSRYIRTNILVRRDQLGKNDRIKDAEVRYKVEDLVKKTEKAISSIDSFALQSMSVEDVVSYIQNYSDEEFRLDFFEFAGMIVNDKKGSSKKNLQLRHQILPVVH